MARPVHRSCEFNVDTGSPAGQVPSTLPPRCLPQGRRASWDSHKCLAFTPPASLTNDRRSRRMSLGLPGGSGKQSQSEDGSILRLPPLTPPGAETNPTCVASAANLLAASTVPDQDLAAVKPACANDIRRPGQSPEQLIAPVQPTALARLVLKDTGRLELRAAVRSQPPLADDADCSRLTQSEAATRVVQPQQQGANPRTLTQQSVQAQTVAEDSWQATANATACDTGQIGPPITRMRPAVVSTSSTPARRASSKEQAAADSLQSAAEAILLDALLCGWEQHGNDGVSPRIKQLLTGQAGQQMQCFSATCHGTINDPNCIHCVPDVCLNVLCWEYIWHLLVHCVLVMPQNSLNISAGALYLLQVRHAVCGMQPTSALRYGRCI